MKKQILFGLTSAAALICVLNTNAAEFVQVQPYVEEKKTEAPQKNYTLSLIDAMETHSLLQQVNRLKSAHDSLELAKEKQAYHEAQFNATNTCNINRLKTYYKNPEAAWNNITKAYHEQEKELTIQINSATPETTAGKEQNRSETMAFWLLGRDVLTDVYANPEKYGDLKNKNTSFPLWEDQKYLYAKDLTAFAGEVHSFFGLKGKIPGLNLKNTYEENAKIYADYLAKLSAKNPQKAASLPINLKKLPTPPSALPPAQEIVGYFDDPSITKSVFPQWPAPWKRFIQSGFEEYNANGEMAHHFIPKTLKLREEIKHQSFEQSNNRLNVYQEQRKTLAAVRQAAKLSQDMENNLLKQLQEKLKKNKISAEINMQDITSIENLKNQLVQRKTEQINEAQNLLKSQKTKTEQPQAVSLQQFAALSYDEQLKALSSFKKGTSEYMEATHILNASQQTQHATYLEALMHDKNGETYIFPSNAQDGEELLKGQQAVQALKKEIMEKQRTEIKKKYEHKIDDSCMNGGV